MSNAPTPTPNILPSAGQIQRLIKIANAFYAAERAGRSFGQRLGSAEAYYAKMLIGLEHGLPPATSISEIELSDSGYSISAALQVTMVRQRGLADIEIERWSPDAGATVTVHRHDWPADRVERVSFSLEDAERANLLRKDNWKKYPGPMCVHRAFSAACHLYMQEICLGLGYIHDELGLETNAAGAIDEHIEFAESAAAQVRAASGSAASTVGQQGDGGGGAVSDPAPPVVEHERPDQGSDDPGQEDQPAAPSGPAEPVSDATRKRIATRLDHAGYSLAEWKEYCRRHGVDSLSQMTQPQADEAVKFLELLDQIHRTRGTVGGPSDQDWKGIVLAKRNAASDLELTHEQASQIYDRLWEQMTPFQRGGNDSAGKARLPRSDSANP